MLTVSHLLSLGWCWMVSFVCFLPVPQHQAGFLHVLTSYLQGFLLLPLEMQAGDQPSSRDVCEWGMWSVVGAHGPTWRIYSWCTPMAHRLSSWRNLKELVGSTSCWCPMRALIAVLLAAPTQVIQHTSVIWVSKERKWASLAVSHVHVLDSDVLPLPYGRKHRPQDHSCHWVVCPGAWEMQVEWKGSSYPLWCIQSPIVFLAPTECWNFSATWTYTKALSSLGDCQNWCSLGEDGRKLLFHILIMSYNKVVYKIFIVILIGISLNL